MRNAKHVILRDGFLARDVVIDKFHQLIFNQNSCRSVKMEPPPPSYSSDTVKTFNRYTTGSDKTQRFER